MMTEKYDTGIECPNGHHGVVTWEEIETPVGHAGKEITLSDVSTGFTLMDWKTRKVRCEQCGAMFQIK